MTISTPKIVSHGQRPTGVHVVDSKPNKIGTWGIGPYEGCTWGSGNPGAYTNIIVTKAPDAGPRRELETFTLEEAVATPTTFFFEIQPRQIGSLSDEFDNLHAVWTQNQVVRLFWDEAAPAEAQNIRQQDIDFSDDSSTDSRESGVLGTHPHVLDARRIFTDELPNRVYIFYVKIPGITAYRISDNLGATFQTEEFEVDTAVPAVLEAEAIFEDLPKDVSDLRDVIVLQRRS